LLYYKPFDSLLFFLASDEVHGGLGRKRRRKKKRKNRRNCNETEGECAESWRQRLLIILVVHSLSLRLADETE